MICHRYEPFLADYRHFCDALKRAFKGLNISTLICNYRSPSALPFRLSVLKVGLLTSFLTFCRASIVQNAVAGSPSLLHEELGHGRMPPDAEAS